jgi:hypothetical protein
MKDAYYFPHDSNAKDDPKCIQLIEELGPEGYGIFWILIETLRSQSDYKAPLSILNGMARRYNTTPEKMRNVVFRFGLFSLTEDDQFFFSESFMRRMEAIDKKRKKLSQAGKKGNSIRWLSPGDSQAIATQSQVKESKEKEIKVKEIKEESEHTRASFPTIEQCRQIAQMSGHSPSYGEAYFYMRDSTDWMIPRGNSGQLYPIQNWRSDYANCYNKGYLNKPELKNDEMKVVKGGLFT